MSCDEIRRLLSERLDQPLDPEQAARLRAHLATCADCRAFERVLSGGMTRLSLLPKSQQSERVRQEVFRYVLLSESGPTRAGRRGWFRQLAGFSAAAIVVVALAAVLVVALRQQVDSGQPARPTTNAQQFGAAATQRASSSANTNKQPTAGASTATAYSAFGAPSTPTAGASATLPAASLSPEEAAAQQLVELFYAAVNQRQYATAFDLYSDEMKASLHQDEKSFADGYATTTQDYLRVSDVQALSSDDSGETTQYQVNVVVVAHHVDGSVTTYVGSYAVGTVGGQAKIVGADIRVQGKDQIAPPSEPTATP